MTTTRTLTLELIRHGPAHNQLLSQLTQYLALSENGAAETIRLPFDHQDFLLRQEALRYQAGSTGSAQLREVGRQLGELLASIPGLVGDLVRESVDEGLLHIRLIISAAELALLPFEAALAPNGAPGAGQPLQVQTVMPITITRQVRRMNARNTHWSPEPPRILFAAASPSEQVPFQQHLDALKEAIAPWRHPARREEALLTVLENATLADIQRECEANHYTHVHILAHGKPGIVGGGERFGLALHSQDRQGEDVLDSRQLIAALLPQVKGRIWRPNAVTIAACDSGNQGSVLAPGASLVHSLHEAGIPLVVGSQFPLTFEGSVIMARVLYEHLLWGWDPRVALHKLRQQLSALGDRNLDWASIVAYAALPADFDEQLRESQTRQAHRAAGVSLARVEQELAKTPGTQPVNEVRQTHERMEKELSRALETLRDATPPKHLPDARMLRTEISGLSGSIEKRRAEALKSTATALSSALAEARTTEKALEVAAFLSQFDRAMERARDHYRTGFHANLSSHWMATQYLFFDALLEKGRIDPDVFAIAHLAAKLDRDSSEPRTRAWGNATLAELELLRVMGGEGTASEAGKRAREYLEEIIRLRPPPSFEIFSTRRQLERYTTWFLPPLSPVLKGFGRSAKVIAMARKLLQILPEVELPDSD